MYVLYIYDPNSHTSVSIRVLRSVIKLSFDLVISTLRAINVMCIITSISRYCETQRSLGSAQPFSTVVKYLAQRGPADCLIQPCPHGQPTLRMMTQAGNDLRITLFVICNVSLYM